jgi:hypothetical protein
MLILYNKLIALLVDNKGFQYLISSIFVRNK